MIERQRVGGGGGCSRNERRTREAEIIRLPRVHTAAAAAAAATAAAAAAMIDQVGRGALY